MPVVVSDTSPILALEFVGCLHVLPKLFDRILVPPAIATELTSTGGRYRKIDVLEHRFLQIASPYDQVHVDLLLQQLDRGEAEAIVLALEYKGPTASNQDSVDAYFAEFANDPSQSGEESDAVTEVFAELADEPIGLVLHHRRLKTDRRATV